MSRSIINNAGSARIRKHVKTLLDTGAFNTMIDIVLAKRYAVLLPNMEFQITIGGNAGLAQGCIIPKLEMGNFVAERVFALAYPFSDWLMRHIIIGANVINNWELTILRAEDELRFCERIPEYVPNKEHPYQNYFKGGEYVAILDDDLKRGQIL